MNNKLDEVTNDIVANNSLNVSKCTDLQVKIKLGPNATMPSYAKPGDAGLDLVATSKKLNKYGCLEFGTEVSLEIPEGFVGLIFPRSSICKKKMSLTNSVGVIDAFYRGEIKFMFKAATAGMGAYDVGDKIGQLIIMPYPKVELIQVDELSETERGVGGWGSSGE